MRDVHVGRSGSKDWEIEHLGDPPDLPKLYTPVTIHFYLEKVGPAKGYVSKIVDKTHFAVRVGPRQIPKL